MTKYILFIGILLIPQFSHAQVSATGCAAILSCAESTEARMKDPLGCLEKRSTKNARICKAYWSPYSESGGVELMQFPLIAFFFLVLWGFFSLKPRKSWLKGMVFGLGVTLVLLVIDSQMLAFATFLNPFAQYIAFPSAGLLSFAPIQIAQLDFGIALAIANSILYAGAFGFASAKVKGATVYSALFIVMALGLSIYDTLIV